MCLLRDFQKVKARIAINFESVMSKKKATNKKTPEKIIGRLREQELLPELIGSNESEFIAVYGRRRVGKDLSH